MEPSMPRIRTFLVPWVICVIAILVVAQVLRGFPVLLFFVGIVAGGLTQLWVLTRLREESRRLWAKDMARIRARRRNRRRQRS